MTYLKTIIALILLVGWLPTFAQTPTPDQPDSELLTRINDLRESIALDPLQVHPALVLAAQQHADWMVETGEVTHIQPEDNKPSDRALEAGYGSSWVSENIYMGLLASEESAWDFWMNSDIHYAGITSTYYQHIGIATAKGTAGQAFVLVFGSGGVSVDDTIILEVTEEISPELTEEMTASPTATATAQATPENNSTITHTVQAGETLGTIVLGYGYTWDMMLTVLELNEITWGEANYLQVGDEILIPAPENAQINEIDITPIRFGLSPTPSGVDESLPPPATYQATDFP